MAGKTNARLCLRDPYCGHIKMCAGSLLIDMTGHELKGSMGANTRRALEHGVTDIPPWAEAYWATVNQSKMDWDEWLIHRARECKSSQKDELRVFREPQWASSWGGVQSAIASGKPLHRDDIMDLQARQIEMDFGDTVGVYIRVHELDERRVRIGKTEKCFKSRLAAHEPGWRTVALFSTLAGAAGSLEKELQDRMLAGEAEKLGTDRHNSFYRMAPSQPSVYQWAAEQASVYRNFFLNTARVQ